MMNPVVETFEAAQRDGHTWSLRSAEVPYTTGNRERSYHAFILLVDDTTGQILDELHVKPYDHPAYMNRPMLGAEAYCNPQRMMSETLSVPYDDGMPRDMLNIWNAALHAGRKITDLEREFQILDCRVGARTIVQNLGYQFQTFPQLGIRFGHDRSLAAELGLLDVCAPPDDATLLRDYAQLHARVNERKPVTAGPVPVRMRTTGMPVPANDRAEDPQ